MFNISDCVNSAKQTGYYSKVKYAKLVDDVVAYGAGTYFKEAFGQWNFKEKMNVSMVCDSNENKQGTMINGIECISPNRLVEISKEKKIFVVVFLGNPIGISRWLNAQGIVNASASECIFEMICDMPQTEEWFEKNKIEEVFASLADEESKEVYGNVIATRISPEYVEKDLSELCSPGEYFGVDMFRFEEDECYVDCGAYNGDTIEQFVETVGPQFRRIYGFEIADENYALLQNNITRISKEKGIESSHFRMMNLGCWDSHTFLTFGKEECGSPEGFSLLKGENSEGIEVVALDEVIDDTVTFIKMDIEGSELSALRGAAGIIKRDKPKLAICIYHRLQDFWEIPMFIKELVPEYKLYVRHHQNGTIGGTVMYAVI